MKKSSKAKEELMTRLADVDELIRAHGLVTGGRIGRPAKRQGAASTRAGVVLLAAAMEAFVEDLFEEAGDLIFSHLSDDARTNLYKQTSRRLNNADVHKTDLLFFNLGCPWILSEIRWQKFSNEEFKRALNKLVETRGSIAHGKQPNVRLQTLRKWKDLVLNYSQRVESEVAKHVKRTTGNSPSWFDEV